MASMNGLTALLFKREYDREFDKWSLSRAEAAEASPEDLYAMIAEMIRNSYAIDPQLANAATTPNTVPNGSKS